MPHKKVSTCGSSQTNLSVCILRMSRAFNRFASSSQIAKMPEYVLREEMLHREGKLVMKTLLKDEWRRFCSSP